MFELTKRTCEHNGWGHWGQLVLFCVIAGCQAVWSQRKAVLLWPQLWAPTPPIWESWTWATIIQETQEWSCSLLDWRIQSGDWTLSGMGRPVEATISLGEKREGWNHCHIVRPVHKTLTPQGDLKQLELINTDHIRQSIQTEEHFLVAALGSRTAM